MKTDITTITDETIDNVTELKNIPCMKYHIGLLTGTIWANGGFHSVTFSRVYKDGDKSWSSSSSFNHGDLLNVARLAERCELWIANHPIKE